MAHPIRVAVMSRHRMLADALALGLRTAPGLALLPVQSSVLAGITQIQREQPNMLVLDHHQDWPDLWRLAAVSGCDNPGAKMIVLADAHDDDLLIRVLEHGGAGLVTKDRPVAVLADSIKRAHRGEVLHEPAHLAGLLVHLDRRRAMGDVGAALAPRESGVLQCIADGMTVDEAAAELGISVHTVRTHIKRILSKLRVHTRTDAVVAGMRHGIIKLSK